MAFWSWSRTANNNATADPTVNYAEGQAPSSLNDSARAAMARLAEYRDDISGAIVTGGISTAYTVASYQGFDTFAHLGNQMIAFTPHATNGATVTLNVDSLGAKPLRSSPGVELQAGTIIQGTPYVATYNNSDGAFYLQGFFGNPYSVPLLGGMDFWDTIAPNSSFIFPAGQAISRTTYSAAFARWNTTYGVGDGSTTFNVPDKTERVSVMKAAVASRLTAAVSGVDGGTMGSASSSQTHTLTMAELPAAAPTVASFSINVPTQGNPTNNPTAQGLISTAASFGLNNTSLSSVNATTGTITLNNLGSGNGHAIVQPTIVTNYIIRII